MIDQVSLTDLIYFEKGQSPEKIIYCSPKLNNKNCRYELYELYYNKNLNKAMLCISWNYNEIPKNRYTFRPEFKYYDSELNNIIEWVGDASDLYNTTKNNEKNIKFHSQHKPININYKHIKNLYKALILMYEYDNKIYQMNM